MSEGIFCPDEHSSAQLSLEKSKRDICNTCVARRKSKKNTNCGATIIREERVESDSRKMSTTLKKKILLTFIIN